MKDHWTDIPGFEGRYQVSTLGRVRSLTRKVQGVSCRGKLFVRVNRGRILRPGTMNEFGHVSVVLGRDGGSRCVHELVLITFRGPRPPGKESRHLNCIGSDNRLKNLKWGTRGENNKDVTRAGKRKLSYSQAKEIRRRAKKENRTRLAEEFGICRSQVNWIVNGRHYA